MAQLAASQPQSISEEVHESLQQGGLSSLDTRRLDKTTGLSDTTDSAELVMVLVRDGLNGGGQGRVVLEFGHCLSRYPCSGQIISLIVANSLAVFRFLRGKPTKRLRYLAT
jgi:hypothetical protein